MKICDNGLKVFFVEREDGKRRWLVEIDGIRSFLHRTISSVQEAEPRYWYLAELGNQTLFLDTSADVSYEAYESVHLVENDAGALLTGDAFAKHYGIYVGDCPAVLSVMKPPIKNPAELLDFYASRMLTEILEEMGEDDLYFYCHEWSWMSFFGHGPTIERIRTVAVSSGFPIEEKLRFSER